MLVWVIRNRQDRQQGVSTLVPSAAPPRIRSTRPAATPAADLGEQIQALGVVYPGLDGLPGVSTFAHQLQEASCGLQGPRAVRALRSPAQHGAHKRFELAQPLPAGDMMLRPAWTSARVPGGSCSHCSAAAGWQDAGNPSLSRAAALTGRCSCCLAAACGQPDAQACFVESFGLVWIQVRVCRLDPLTLQQLQSAQRAETGAALWG